MLFSLITASALPILGSVLEGQQFATNPNQEVITLSQQELALIEAEASGYQKVLEREPNNDTALNGLLKIRLQQKDLNSAIAPLETLAKLHPEQTEYSTLLAQAKSQIEDYEGAAAVYNEVLAEHPGDIYALGGITNLYLTQSLPERAIALLKKTIKLADNADSPQAGSINREAVELLLGELYTNQKRYGEAIALYDRLAQLDQTDFRPILAKALVLEKKGDLSAAQPVLQKAYIAAPEQYKDQIGQEMERIVKEIKVSKADNQKSALSVE
ncbi:MAG: tetratricopeptide repeat protein [Pleurocapsa minor HA4230-MV1]|nr:tetratricopeptide repeat protein [Pleurocapsa minor HA4230-MV1]